MNKNPMEDMIKIKIVKKKQLPKIEEIEYSQKPLPREPKKLKKEKGGGPRYMLWFVAFVCLIFLFFAFSYMFSSASVTINPKVENIAIDENLSASKDSNTSPVSFDLVVISGEESQNIKTDNKENVAIPATGTVIIYNAFSTQPQTLLIDTRLEGSNGKIYKTNKRVIVPGMSADNQPGKIEIGIYGDSAGKEYNSTPLDFKIFGFKGTPKYEKFYARSRGDITGGATGSFYSITTEQKDQALVYLKNALRDKLLKKVSEQIPKGFVLFDEAISLDINDQNVQSFSDTSLVPVTVKGTLYGLLFNEAKLTKKIAEDVLDNYDDSDIYIANIKNLTLAIANKESLIFSDVKNIDFILKGSTKIVWRFDVEKFSKELLGKKKRDFNSVISKYPNVVSFNLALKPFWRMSLPDKLDKIKVIVNYPK